MSDAIEHLKEMISDKQKEQANINIKYIFGKALFDLKQEKINALNEALLALEQLSGYKKNFEYHVKCDEEIRQLKEKNKNERKQGALEELKRQIILHEKVCKDLMKQKNGEAWFVHQGTIFQLQQRIKELEEGVSK